MSLIIEKAASVKDGTILKLTPEEEARYLGMADSFEGTLCKFTPASGAATRMFKPLYEEGEAADRVRRQLREKTPVDFTIDRNILSSTPKGLIPFHKYAMFVRTPLEEHLVEGAMYAKDKRGIVRLHFTVSQEHLEDFKRLFSSVRAGYENRYNCRYDAVFTTQDHATDVTAYDEDGKPFLKEDGTVLKRPAGHGALLANLSLCDEDFIFIKNIDNVVKEPFLDDTIKWKKILLGMAIHLKETLGNSLDRPIRVCGMVRNEGEPGGGPFVCREKDGSTSLQILESVQIEDKSLMKESTHFNPVDIVCCIKDAQGNKFDLQRFTDPETGLSVEKTYEGRKAKYTELPGLWNGSMSRWHTVFVEVPISTFNPVKTVADLLRPAHQ
ncbi:MAG: DUF4301 family protein [Bacteroidales bacterium]|nr:DUF4301 family protein [Bacteroidales bacterium]